MRELLPINPKEVANRGWEEVDFVCVTGDAYVDHPSFGIAIISRVLESQGYKVAMLSQPKKEQFKQYGKPRYGFMITSGNIDSMVCNYTSARRKRSDDAYSAGNKAGARPDRAVTVYTQMAKAAYPDVPVVIGGIEASLRRFAHYDYWSDSVHPSILVESGADLLSYGMGEHQTVEIANRLASGEAIATMTDIRGTCCILPDPTFIPFGTVTCPTYEGVVEKKENYLRGFQMQMDNQDHIYGKPLLQKHGKTYVLQNPPAVPLTTDELDQVFDLPFTRTYHPSYEEKGGVKAIEEVEFSIMHNRGCFGYCNFCAIAGHQGRQIVSRSKESVVREAESFVGNPRFKGYIHDVGGPTANFRIPSCTKQETLGMCKDRKCLGFSPCPALKVDHSDYLDLLRELRGIKGIKKVFVRSGLRFDYMLLDKDDTFFKEIVDHHISGQLKVAPEHCSDRVLKAMGKPPVSVYEAFVRKFYKITKEMHKEQYLVPYLMSSHPGSTLKDALELSLFLKKNKLRPEQVQDFYPTPGSISTCMFYTGIDPTTNEEVYIPRTDGEKHQQRALLQYFRPENRRLVLDALVKIHREDLIGTGGDCLVAPDKEYLAYKQKQEQKRDQKKPQKREKNIKQKGKEDPFARRISAKSGRTNPKKK